MKSGPTPPTSWVISFWAYWPQGEFSCSTLMPVFSSTIGLYWLNCSPHQWVWRRVPFEPAAGLAAAGAGFPPCGTAAGAVVAAGLVGSAAAGFAGSAAAGLVGSAAAGFDGALVGAGAAPQAASAAAAPPT